MLLAGMQTSRTHRQVAAVSSQRRRDGVRVTAIRRGLDENWSVWKGESRWRPSLQRSQAAGELQLPGLAGVKVSGLESDQRPDGPLRMLR